MHRKIKNTGYKTCTSYESVGEHLIKVHPRLNNRCLQLGLRATIQTLTSPFVKKMKYECSDHMLAAGTIR